MLLGLLLLSYLLGSIPFSHIFPRLKGKDVKGAGTKNVGATNALVVAGPIIGALAWIGDVGKGFAAVYLAQTLVGDPLVICFAGVAAIIGHDFSIFLKFKGGKGVATTAGVLLAIDPILWFIVLLLWILLILVTRFFILSSLIMIGILPMLMWVLGKRIEYAVLFLLAFLLVLYTHREDIKRMIAGQELTTSESISHYMKK
ncbi:glycerol-3-phosphate 1-O-acyltransferase PlsY [Candidatus Margulisiibacteriota bacterium]